jgi:predicted DNA-binding protein (UPF0251 family)
VGSADAEPDRPERQLLLEAHQEQIRAANATLPARQREALALRELEELSYDEIAEIMGMNRNSVAQLLSRARIGLRDSLRRSALGSIASASPDCERALPLLALRQDGAPAPDAASADWLAQHLSACSVCPARVAAMEEAGAVYRLWLPLVPAVWLRGEAIANAAEHVGADWSRHPAAGGDGAPPVRPRPRRARRLGAGCTAAVFMLLPGALVAADAADAPATPAPVTAHVRGWSAPGSSPTATATASPTAAPSRSPDVPRAREAPDSAHPVARRVVRSHPSPASAHLDAEAPSPAKAARPGRDRPEPVADPGSPPAVDDGPPDPSAPDVDAPVEVSTCGGAAPVPARPDGAPCSERPCAAGGSTPPPRFCRPCRPGGPDPPRGVCPDPPCEPSAPPAAKCPARPRPLGPDRLRDRGEAAPDPPVAGRARPSP